MESTDPKPAEAPSPEQKTALKVLLALSFAHMLNDTIQAVLPAIYPLLKQSFHLTFTQVGLITLVFQGTASLLQPFVGYFSDRRPRPFSLVAGMGCTLLGLVMLAKSNSFGWVLISAGVVGAGSSIFHPEASRVARMAAGERHGFAQSLFQVGGNTGTFLGPVLVALIVVPNGQASVLWFSLVAILGIAVLSKVGGWQKRQLIRLAARLRPREEGPGLPRRTVVFSVVILMALIFSKYFYLVSLTSYYTFYLMAKFHIGTRSADFCLGAFLFAVAAGTIIGGPLGDRFGRKYVIWVSILGVAPFTLLLPHVGLAWTIALSVVIGLVLSSAFSAILVYAQDLIPGRVGLIAGLFFGFAFGMAGIGSAVLGDLADHTSITFVYQICAYLPLIGLLTAFLPNLEHRRRG